MEIFGDRSNPGYSSAYQARREVTLNLISQYFAPGASILDVAAAQGNFSLAAAEAGYSVTWNDLRSDLEGYVRLKDSTGCLTYLPGNVLDLGLQEEFDGIILTEIIEHVAHPDDFLLQISKLLKPGGKIVMTTPNGGYVRNDLPKFSDCADPSVYEASQFKPNSDGHIFLLHPDELISLAQKAGLEVKAMTFFCNPLTAGHMQLWRLLKILPPALVKLVEHGTAKLPSTLLQQIHCHAACVYQKAG